MEDMDTGVSDMDTDMEDSMADILLTNLHDDRLFLST